MSTQTQTETETAVATQVYRVYIKATPEAIWDAITKPEWTKRYGYRGEVEFDSFEAGGNIRFLAPPEMREMGMPEVVVDGEVVEADPPRRLVHTWHPMWSEEIAAETTRVTFDIEEDDAGVTRLTVTHEVEGAPLTAAQVGLTRARMFEGGGGWPMILSDLKTLLETGSSLT
jgi:uncharacterized protein YndB with AHSA1/START domain